MPHQTAAPRESSLIAQAFVFERYGPRLGTDQLAEFLEVEKTTLYNQITNGTCPIRTYLAPNGRRYADFRDVAKHLDELRETAA